MKSSSVSVSRNRPAMALLAVLVLVMMAALSAYGFTFYMESQYRASRVFEEQVYARQAALNATEMVAAILELSPQQRAALGGLDSNPSLFRDIVMEAKLSAQLYDDHNNYWRASIIAPSLGPPETNSPTLTGVGSAIGEEAGIGAGVGLGYEFGLENETAKIPLMGLLQWDQRLPGHAKQVLLNLPGATETIVDAFLRENLSHFTYGSANRRVSEQNANRDAELGSITTRSSGSNPQDTQTIKDQLQWLWLGGDLNQNYRIDSLEAAWQANKNGSYGATRDLNATSVTAGVSSLSAQTPVGLAWQRYLTWNSGARNESQSGQPRVDINQSDLRQLHQQLLAIWPEEWANYVVVFRQYGGSPERTASSGAVANDSSAIAPDFSIPASQTILSPLQLIGNVSQIPAADNSTAGKSRKRMVFSPFQPDISQLGNYLSKLLDEVTIGGELTDRIDVNGASLPVLLAIPGMDRQLAETIIQRRDGQTSGATRSNDSTIAWLLQEGVVDLPRLVTLEPYITGRSDVYSCQIVGYRDPQSAVYRCTLTIDARELPSVKRNIQTWHSWDRGFSTTEFSMQR